MGNSLICELYMDSEKDSRYWWPLAFEAMHRRGFHFPSPEQPEGTGFYYYLRRGNETDTDFVNASFRATWDEIYTESSDVLVSFWGHDNAHNVFPLDITIDPVREKGLIHIRLYLNDASLFEETVKEMQSRLRLFFQCAHSLYELCRPCTGEVSWTSMEAPLATFAQPLNTPLSSHTQKGIPSVRIIEQQLGDGEKMYRLDPIPVRTRAGYVFVSLP